MRVVVYRLYRNRGRLPATPPTVDGGPVVVAARDQVAASYPRDLDYWSVAGRLIVHAAECGSSSFKPSVGIGAARESRATSSIMGSPMVPEIRYADRLITLASC